MNTPDKNTSEESDTTDILKAVWQVLETVSDPEVPVLSVVDLGIIREVTVTPSQLPGLPPQLTIAVTPTYSGCPAIDVMNMNIRMALIQAGFTNISIRQLLSPAWTTDWMSEKGKEKLKAYGITPPQYKQAVCTPDAFQAEEAIPCPLCNSYHTRLVSQFGSTACKALYQCNDCHEPFDYFKCH